MAMLEQGISGRVRLECVSCGAHALLHDEDHRHLAELEDGHMRCEVCGHYTAFEPTEPHDRELSVVTAR
jgi:hypothetical protein